jgi:hypothetical protein
MPNSDLDRLAALIRREHASLLAAWRKQVRNLPAARHLDTPTLNDHVPQLIEELAAALQGKVGRDHPEALSEASPPAHGMQRVRTATTSRKSSRSTTSCAAASTISPRRTGSPCRASRSTS